MQVSLAGVTVRLGGVRVVDGVDLEVPSGSIACIVGPNGSGKSTLLRTVYRVIRPEGGTVRVGGDDVWEMTARDSARRTAIVVQEPPLEFDFTVGEMVSMGRNPHHGTLDGDDMVDRRIVEAALESVGIAFLVERSFTRLSGGEKQRVMIARALAQESRLLVLDEPTNHLDVRYQLEVMEMVKQMGITSLVALHDLDLAIAYADLVAVMSEGRVVASGPPSEVVTPQVMADVFGVAAAFVDHPLTGQSHLALAPLGMPVGGQC